MPELIAAAAAAGVQRMVTIGCGREQSEQAVAIAEAHPQVYAAVGVHPVDAGKGNWRPDDVAWIRDLAQHERVVAIGEAGLDYFHERTTPAASGLISPPTRLIMAGFDIHLKIQ